EFPHGDEELKRFVQTMKPVLGLSHPNLIGFQGAGKTGPYCWIAMEYIEGESLVQVLERVSSPGKLSWKHALRIGIHVGRALQFIHEHHLTHAHVVPSNILIRLSDKTVKLGGLLVSKALAGSQLQVARRKAMTVAELPYMAPERTEPGAFVDSLYDVYDLGTSS